jgi:hypothetical protein
VIHIINEAASPSSEMTTTMWCGAMCVELFDGGRTPGIDYCWEAQAETSTCAECITAFARRVVSL